MMGGALGQTRSASRFFDRHRAGFSFIFYAPADASMVAA